MSPVKAIRSVLVSAVFAALSACSLTPAYERPAATLPDEWPSTAPADAVSVARWDEMFGSEELRDLMAQALAANHDLAAAKARIEQARASASIARARLLPYASAGVSASRNREGDGENRSLRSTDQSLLTVGYEADLFGGYRAAAGAAQARLAASEFDWDATRLVLQADVASYYVQVLALKDRLAIARKNLEVARELMSLVEVRFRNGAASALEVAQQRATLLSVEAEVPALQQSLVETQSALAVLVGRSPEGFEVEATTLAALTLPGIAPGQPAELLQRRPDIRAAEARLVAAHADIGAARAALYPSLQLSGSTGVTGWLTGGSSTIASLAASLAQTIFDGGELRGQVRLTEAVREELVESYLQAVLTSTKDVHDSLSAVQTTQARIELLTQNVEEARTALRIATARYRAGTDDLLALLETQRSLFSAEANLVQARLDGLNASIGLFKALGGEWSEAGQS